jgi:hypothetical protein
LSWSEGAVKPTPPNTCLGTMKKEDAIAAFLIKSLRVCPEEGCSGFFMGYSNCEDLIVRQNRD